MYKAHRSAVLNACIAFLLLIALGVSRSASGQGGTASISGTVLDITGAVIRGAQVKVTQTDTGIVQTTASGDDGSFTVLFLPVGSYSLHVESPGFAAYEQTGIVLTVGQVASVNISLKPGTATQNVTVQANAQIVETTESNSSTLVDTAQVVGLPLNGRNPATLVFLTGGTDNPVINVPPSNTGNGNLTNSLVFQTEIAPVVHGVRAGGVYFSLDGVNNLDVFEVSGGPFPNPDATQEFNVVSGNYGAEYVSAPGGAVNIVTKSGTNQIHGAAFEFIRNGFFNARNFFSTTPDQLKRNQFGGVVGGPIKRDKWFYFGSWQYTTLVNNVGGNVQFVPSPAERTGDFRQLSTPIVNPFTGQQYSYNGANNVIPPSSLDPTMQGLLAYIPSRSAPLGATVIPGTGASPDEVIYTQPENEPQQEFAVKSDYTFGNHRMFGRFFYSTFKWLPNGIPSGDILASYRGAHSEWINAAYGDTWTRGSLVSDFRLGYVRDVSVTSAGETTVSLTSLGSQITQGQPPTIQSFAVTGGFQIQSGNWNYYPRNTIIPSEAVTYIRGRHEISFGAGIQFINILLSTETGSHGSASFTGAETSNAIADYIIGIQPAFSQGDGIWNHGSGVLPGFYGEDRYKWTPKLTVTAGLRWDPYRPYTSLRMECYQPGQQSAAFANAPIGLTFAGDRGCDSRGTNASYGGIGAIQPRLGFAYQLDSKGNTVVRGGYGVYSTQFNLVNFLGFGRVQPFERSIAIANSSTISITTPWATYPGGNPFAGGFELNGAPRSPSTVFLTPVNTASFNPGFKMPYVQQWSLITERALATNDVVTLSYFGTKGTHLGFLSPDNQAVYVPGITAAPGTPGASCVLGQYNTTKIGQACSTVANIQYRRPDTSLDAINALTTGENSVYHGVEIEYHHRFNAGFTLSSAFTYSRSIDITSTPGTLVESGGGIIPDPADINLRRGPSDFNQPYTWRTNGVWNLPFGKNFTGVPGMLAKGWVWSGIFTRDAGLPVNILTTNTDNSLTNNGLDVANVVPGVPRRVAVSDFTAASKGLSIINPAAFAVNPVGTYGVSGRNAFNTPDYTDFDTAVSKEFILRESLRFQFRAEAFDALNHPQFWFSTAPTLGATSTFGKLQSARDPRILQFSGKFVF